MRGNSAFLDAASKWTSATAGGDVLSPALYPSGTGIWQRCGYEVDLRLEIMEASLTSRAEMGPVGVATNPNLVEMEDVDREAFDSFWPMGSTGLAEALSATRVSTVLEVRAEDRGLLGYAIVGAQLGMSFLQRIAVRPSHAGQGLGAALVDAAKAWALGRGCAVMVLNVRPVNERAIGLYQRAGFQATGKHLLVLRFRR
ncbi:MAG: GNAT family N-acetyltransferase [Actinobacteria bacterium]|nr:MAG: GNAT family N-acetyltransferase [Actinomycetota bacterium]